MITKEVSVSNRLGLHARPSALLAKTANMYSCSTTITHKGRTVDCKSILGLMTMALPFGSIVKIECDGPNEENCLQHITDLFENKFGEE